MPISVATCPATRMVAAVITLARMLAITRPDHHVLHRECLLRTVRAYLTFSFGVVGYSRHSRRVANARLSLDQRVRGLVPLAGRARGVWLVRNSLSDTLDQPLTCGFAVEVLRLSHEIAAQQLFGEALAGSDRPLVISSGTGKGPGGRALPRRRRGRCCPARHRRGDRRGAEDAGRADHTAGGTGVVRLDGAARHDRSCGLQCPDAPTAGLETHRAGPARRPGQHRLQHGAGVSNTRKLSGP